MESSILDEFKDVEPIAEADVPNGICKVRYYGNFESLISILRACIKSGELSDRVFRLTGEIIQLNTPYITAWVTRQNCILKNGVDWDKEFEFLESIRLINEKCYQTWMHRHFVVQTSGIYDKEKEYCDSYIKLDHKNIHAWSHRAWIVETYNLWEGELEYTDKYINNDVFNNSAWSHRFFITSHFIKTSEDIEKELDYVLSKIHLAPHNDAAWNYLIGMINQYKDYCYTDVIYEVKNMLKAYPDIDKAYYLLIMYNRSTFEEEGLKESLTYCDILQTVDAIRCDYWKHMKETIQNDIDFLVQLNAFYVC